MPTTDQVDAAIEEILKRRANYEYFFSRLTDPTWIKPLREHGFLRHPQPIERGEDFVRYPPWPESEFLARVADQDPGTVLDTILAMEPTDNQSVHQDIADAACAMPPHMAASLAVRETEWLRGEERLSFLLPQKLSALIVILAEGGEHEAALLLSSALFSPLPDHRPRRERSVGEDFVFSPEPRLRMDSWMYKEALKKVVGPLAQCAGLESLRVFTALLSEAIPLQRDSQPREPSFDGSYWWRPAIEDHDQNNSRRVTDYLVEAVRDSAEVLMQTRPLETLKEVERQQYDIFRRIGLHLRRLWPTADPEKTANLIVDKDLFANVRFHHEYYHLVRERFGSLDQGLQEDYLKLVDTGPSSDQLSNLDDDGVARNSRFWEYRMLSPVAEHLDGKWRARFKEHRAEFGIPEMPMDFHVYHGPTTVGPTSPKDQRELSKMSVSDVVSYLRTWEPAEGLTDPSPEGLGRALTEAVKSKPEEYAGAALEFEPLDPTYVRAVVRGLDDAVAANKKFPWEPVLNLCAKVLEKPREIPDRDGPYADLDPDWIWTRKSIASLIGRGFETYPNELPQKLRRQAWRIIAHLTDDPDPKDDDYHIRRPRSRIDPATESINCTRGEAMHAAVKYGLWVRRHVRNRLTDEGGEWKGFSEIPELKDVLEAHLDPEHDPSAAIRSVYGRWFPWLCNLDRAWAEASIPRIFPKETGLAPLRDAAWIAYLSFCDVYDSVFDLLEGEYRIALERIGEDPPWDHPLENPGERLAEHILVRYCRGASALGDPGSLISLLLEKSSSELRAHAMEFLGRVLLDTPVTAKPAFFDRVRSYWENRIEVAGRAEDKESYREEISGFGWWFHAGRLGTRWELEQLQKAVVLGEGVEPFHSVLERLAEIAPDFPRETMQSVRLMVERGIQPWHLQTSESELRQIFEIALKSDDPGLSEIAIDVINRLGAAGNLRFRDLVQGR